MSDVLSLINIKAKFLCKNYMVMYHIQIDNNDYLISSNLFNNIVREAGFTLGGMSSVMRVNVADNNGNGYVVKTDSNPSSVISFYGNRLLLPQDSDNLSSLILNKLKNAWTCDKDKIQKWLKEKKFFKCMLDNGTCFCLISHSNINQRSSDGYFPESVCQSYILCSDLYKCGFSESDANIIGQALIFSDKNNSKVSSIEASSDMGGWCITHIIDNCNAYRFNSDKPIKFSLRLKYNFAKGYYSSLLRPINRSFNYQELPMIISQFGSIPIKQEKETIEALMYSMYLKNGMVSGYDNNLPIVKNDTINGHIIVSDKVKRYVEKALNVHN